MRQSSVQTLWPLLALGLACGREEPPPEVTSGGQGSGGINLGTDTDSETAGHEDEELLDVGSGQGGGPGPGDCPGGGGMDEEAFSIIWIANSPEGTVSKIDTKTGEELARYYTGPTNGEDDPSRTSVNLEGDVAVTNRAGGIVKIAAHEDRCVDRDGNGSIETSQSKDDVLPFGEDECLLWYTELPSDGDNRHGPRPTAWDAGGGNNVCQTGDDRVWVGWWEYDNNLARFVRLDGGTGQQLDEVEVPGWDVDPSTHYGPYGGAVDASGSFWVSGRSPGPLVRIDGETLEVRRWEVPEQSSPYGIALDAEGHPWMAGTDGYVIHFDPDTEQFDLIELEGTSRGRGLQIDRDGYAWVAANDPCGAVQIDTTTLQQVGGLIELPGCDDPVGVSIDSEGFVWLPDRGADLAFKLDPDSYATTTTMGLIAPYTYSDMTGAGLGLVTSPPAG